VAEAVVTPRPLLLWKVRDPRPQNSPRLSAATGALSTPTLPPRSGEGVEPSSAIRRAPPVLKFGPQGSAHPISTTLRAAQVLSTDLRIAELGTRFGTRSRRRSQAGVDAPGTVAVGPQRPRSRSELRPRLARFSRIMFSVMRTSAPTILPLFRSGTQIELLRPLLLQPERSWTQQELAGCITAPASSVHRALGRAEPGRHHHTGRHGASARIRSRHDDAFDAPLVQLLSRSVGVEQELRAGLDAQPGVLAAVIHGSWAGDSRRPNSEIDILVVGHTRTPAPAA
jgi:hypothetical protein